MFDAARARPGALTLASVGPASTQHIAFEMLRHLAGVNMIFVPFNGNGPAVNALLGKHVDSILVNYSEVAEQLQDGTFRALATTSRSRIGELPQVPAVAELGFSDFEAEVWFGAVVPARTPAAVVSELADWLRTALDAPTVKPKLKALGLYTVGRCGDAFAAELRRRFDDYGRAIRESNIRVE
jgi:tripartite-type tricarboxylate transporter receptor subunit TctC